MLTFGAGLVLKELAELDQGIKQRLRHLFLVIRGRQLRFLLRVSRTCVVPEIVFQRPDEAI